MGYRSNTRTAKLRRKQALLEEQEMTQKKNDADPAIPIDPVAAMAAGLETQRKMYERLENMDHGLSALAVELRRNEKAREAASKELADALKAGEQARETSGAALATTMNNIEKLLTMAIQRQAGAAPVTIEHAPQSTVANNTSDSKRLADRRRKMLERPLERWEFAIEEDVLALENRRAKMHLDVETAVAVPEIMEAATQRLRTLENDIAVLKGRESLLPGERQQLRDAMKERAEIITIYRQQRTSEEVLALDRTMKGATLGGMTAMAAGAAMFAGAVAPVAMLVGLGMATGVLFANRPRSII